MLRLNIHLDLEVCEVSQHSPKYILIVFTIMIDIKTPANYTSNPTILLRESFLIYLPSYRWKRSATIQTLNKFEFNVNKFEISLHAGGDVRGLFKMPQMRKEYKINFHHPTYKGLLFKFKFAQYSNLPFALSCTICPLMRWSARIKAAPPLSQGTNTIANFSWKSFKVLDWSVLWINHMWPKKSHYNIFWFTCHLICKFILSYFYSK